MAMGGGHDHERGEVRQTRLLVSSKIEKESDKLQVEEEKKEGEQIEEPKESQDDKSPEVALPLDEIHSIDEKHKIALLRFESEDQAIKYYVAKRQDAQLKLITSHQVAQLLDPRYYT